MLEYLSRTMHAPVAQGIECWVADPKAVGSIPTRRTRTARSEARASGSIYPNRTLFVSEVEVTCGHGVQSVWRRERSGCSDVRAL